jgi:hypothetical protein
MPFDGNAVYAKNKSLAQLLEEWGIETVPMESLEEHKLSQVEKYGPSFWCRHQTLLQCALVVTICVDWLACAEEMFAWRLLPAMLFAVIFSGLFSLGFLSFKTRSGSHWEERFVNDIQLEPVGVPEQILLIARSLCHRLKGSDLILGELMQESVVLDPYLLLRYGEDNVCLGIWDADKRGNPITIASAQMHD